MIDCNETVIPTFSGVYQGANVYFLGKIKCGTKFTKNKLTKSKNGGIPQLIYDEWRCMTCVERVSDLSRYIGKDGVFLCGNDSENKSENHHEVERHVKANYDSNKSISKCELTIMYNDLFKLTDGVDEVEGAYHHYSYKLDNKSVYNTDLKKLGDCFRKYINILDTFFGKIDDNLEFLECLVILKRCINKVGYGYKLSPGTEWLINNVEYMNTLFDDDQGVKCYNYLPFLKKLEFLGNVMCNSSISKGANDDDVNMLEHSQANNSLLNLLKNAKNEKSLMSMIRKQVSPENYQRPTGEPKLGNIKAAESKLGEFSNSIYTMDKLEKHSDCVKVKSKVVSEVNSSMGAFAKMKDASNSKPSKYGGLSKRCGNRIEIKNMRDLIEKLKDGSIYKLSINAKNLTTGYISDTTLDRDKIINDYLWLYLNGETTGSRFSGYVDISHVNVTDIPSHRNILFIASDVREKVVSRPIKNCCLPEFLDTSIRRECSSAFEKMNSFTNVIIPKSGDLAFGIGTSIIGVENKLNNTINILINDEHTVRVLTEY